jgi:hypothetical protein
MFPPAESPIRATLRHFLDVAIEFATLGEYTLDGPAEPPAAISPGPRVRRGATSPGARPEREAEAAGARLAMALSAQLRPATAAARSAQAGAAGRLSEDLPAQLERLVAAQAAELARCAAGQRRNRHEVARTLPRRKRHRHGAPRPVPQTCMHAERP